MTCSSHEDLVRTDLIGKALADALDDDRWLTLEVNLIPGGKSNLTFELVSDAGSVVLRRPPSGELLPRAHDMAREARVQRALLGTQVPVAPILLDEPSGELLGVPFYVMQRVDGHVIRDHLPQGYADSVMDRNAIADALVDTLVALHRIDPREVGLQEFGRADGYIERQLHRWSDQWDRSKSQEVPVVEALATELAARLPRARSRPAILHGDFRLDNCLMDPASPRKVAAVLDWELSTLGTPLADLGLLLFYWREPGEVSPMLTPSPTALGGFPGRAHLLERYAAGSGLDLFDLPFYVAFAHFKFAVITQGVAARVATGVMAGQDFGDLGADVALIADQGLARLEDGS